MDELLPIFTLIVAAGGLGVGLSVLRETRLLSQRMEVLEIDRAWFNNHREEQLQSLHGEVLELRSLVADLLDGQAGDGRRQYDPDDPR